MNKENKFPFLDMWCEKYYETVGLKVHSSNVPVDVVLDELMGGLESLRKYYNNLVGVYTSANHRISELETLITQLTEQLVNKDLTKNEPTKKKVKE